jgi:hypothetical protein
MALLLGGLSLAVTSCKDDDNSNNDGNDPETVDGKKDAANRFWGVATNLVSPFDVTDEYEDMTFEPTIGEPLDGNSAVRVVNATDISVAAARFASMTGTGVDATTATYTFQDDAVGTLVYNKCTDGKSLATVDVSIKQIPHLEQIVYMTPEQMGDNAVNDGIPFYSFGDVISRPNKGGKTEYWVCIHPAFTKQKIATTQWATVSPLPENNVWKHTGSNGIEYALPTGLGQHNVEMQQLAELLFALTFQQTWKENLGNANCPMPFGDIKRENMKYISPEFFVRVAQGWEEKKIGQLLFGTDVLTLVGKAQSTGIHFLGLGYNWKTLLIGNNSPRLHQYTYANGSGKDANMHRFSYEKVEKEVIKSRIVLNCQTQISAEKPYWENEAFFGDKEPRYIFRTASGKELLSGDEFNAYTTMASGKARIKDEYVYTQKYNIPVSPNATMDEYYVISEPQHALSTPVIGSIVAANGAFYKSMADVQADHTQAVAVVSYLGGKYRIEKGTNFNGLAVAIEALEGQTMWNDAYSQDHAPDQVYVYDRASTFTGIADTKKYAAGCGKDHPHLAAQKVMQLDATTLKNKGFSEWFIPSSGQWMKVLESYGFTWENGDIFSDQNSLSKAERLNLVRKYWVVAGLAEQFDKIASLNTFVSTTNATMNYFDQTASKLYYTFSFNDNQVANYTRLGAGQTNTLPFIAFKYDGGGKEDIPSTPAISEKPYLGMLLATDGYFYRHKKILITQNRDLECYALVSYLGGKKRVEKNESWNALAVSISAAPNMLTMWDADYDSDHNNDYVNDYSQFASTLNGLQNQSKLGPNGCSAKHHHAAVEYVETLNAAWNVVNGRKDVLSNWFIPSVGQVIKVMEGASCEWKPEWNYFLDTGNMRKLWKRAGLEKEFDTIVKGYPFWTTTFHRDVDKEYVNQFYTFLFDQASGFEKMAGASFAKVLPFMAIKYDGGATED